MFQLLLLSAGVFVLVWVAWNLHLGLQRRYGPKLSFPVVGTASDRDFKNAINEGYRKVTVPGLVTWLRSGVPARCTHRQP